MLISPGSVQENLRKTNKQQQHSGEHSRPRGLQASTVPNSSLWLFIDNPNFRTVDAFEVKSQDERLNEVPPTPNTNKKVISCRKKPITQTPESSLLCLGSLYWHFFYFIFFISCFLGNYFIWDKSKRVILMLTCILRNELHFLQVKCIPWRKVAVFIKLRP